jgi:hypothetical protein
VTTELPTSLRATWTATIQAEKLAVLAAKRADYHRIREQHWQQEEKTADDDYRGSIKVREHEITGGTRLGVEASQDLAARLEECKRKRHYHCAKAEEYEVWEAFAELHAGTLHLTYSDAQHFHLGIEYDTED